MKLNKNSHWFTGATLLLWVNLCNAQDPSESYVSPSRGDGNFEGRTDRPLRYQPDAGDFVIENGGEFFNRPLYGGHTAFRVDGGDQPELSLYAPGQAGNLRLGVRNANGATWLFDAQHRVTRYRGGSLIYEIRDPLLGEAATLIVTALALNAQEGLILRAQLQGESSAGTELIWAYGGAGGKRGVRNGDIGTEAVPIGQFFQLTPEACAENKYSLGRKGFEMQSKTATIRGVASAGVKFSLADCKQWSSIDALLKPRSSLQPLVVARSALQPDNAVYFALTRDRALDAKSLAAVFDAAEDYRRSIATRIAVETPDPFINSAMPALLTAADGIWDDEKNVFMHGAVAWRAPLLGWRGAYSGDALGWHDRARRYFDSWATKQNTADAPTALPAQDHLANLARNEPGLHTRGDLSNSHYDMNLVYIDALFRHLLWTGDVDYARKMWPTIERHLEWERRSFRRTFSSKGLPLYEGYAAIWASDDLEYHGGGTAHASAYNYFHNVMAARIARRIGKDASPYETEAEQILTAMRELLWLPHEGWYAEFKDGLGLQLVHPSAGLWTVYHAMDSQVTNPLDAWQLTRYVDTQIAHIPIKGTGIPPGGYYTLPTTNWMPYSWSINNVAMAEAVHTSLAFWQAERSDEAFKLFKGALLDSMYLGLCPGNVGMTTAFDMARRESQRDFGDSIGATSRTIIEGLFGVHPDALDGELLVKPGFPKEWTRARLQHTDFDLQFERTPGAGSQTDRYVIEPKWQTPMKLRLRAAAPLTRVTKVSVNGQAATWRALINSVGVPRIEIDPPEAAAKYEVVIVWGGTAPATAQITATAKPGTPVSASTGAAQILDAANPQSALSKIQFKGNKLTGAAAGQPGARTVFAKVKQGDLIWWAPLAFEIKASAPREAVDWKSLSSAKIHWRTIPLTEQFNDSVTQIFRNEYVRPRPQTVSLSIPKQGYGSWTHYDAKFEVDDSGLRAAAESNGGKISVSGVPFITPTATGEKNIAFTSRWENYPPEVSVPLSGKARHAYFLMAGSTNWMQSRLDNAEIVITYKDGGSERLALHNPTNWWPIDQDYFIDDYAFRRPEPIPPRVDLKTGAVRIQSVAKAKGHGGIIEGGAATVLDLPLNPARELKSATLRTLSNEVVIGLMSLTLASP
jgi:hypothetical protein